MTDCLNFEQQISALIDGELPEAERQVLEAHLETCPDCMETYHMFSDISAAMHDISYEVPFDLKDRVLEQIEEEKVTSIEDGRKRWNWKHYAAMAAAFAVVAGVAIFAGGWALEQVWMFWVAPIVGAVIGAIVYRIVGARD